MSIVDRVRAVLQGGMSRFRKSLSDDDDEFLETIEAEEVITLEEASPQVAPPTEKKVSIDEFFTKMPATQESTTVEIKDILPPPAPAAEPAPKPVEAPKEPSPFVSKDDGLISSLFEADETEENSTTASLIASLPEVTMEEIFKDIDDVNALMAELVLSNKVNARREPLPEEAAPTDPGKLPQTG